MFSSNRSFVYLAMLIVACLLFSCGKKDQLQPIEKDKPSLKAGTVNGGTVLEPVTFDYDGTGDISGTDPDLEVTGISGAAPRVTWTVNVVFSSDPDTRYRYAISDWYIIPKLPTVFYNVGGWECRRVATITWRDITAYPIPGYPPTQVTWSYGANYVYTYTRPFTQTVVKTRQATGNVTRVYN